MPIERGKVHHNMNGMFSIVNYENNTGDQVERRYRN